MSEENIIPKRPPKYLIKILIGVVVGLLLGYAYYYFVGCRSGACPLRANPYYNLLLGGLIGYLVTDWILMASHKRKYKNKQGEQ